MRFLMCGAVLSAAMIGGIAFATASGAAGLDGLHEQVRMGDRICMVGHDHYGESGSWNTRPEAMASAARSWGGFTGLEYGREWGEYQLATNQSMNCSKVDNDRGGVFWSCKAKATPCRPATPIEVAGAPAPIVVAERAAPVVAVREPAYVPAPVVERAPVVVEVPQVSYRARGHWRPRHPGMVWQGHAFRPNLSRHGHVEGYAHGHYGYGVHGYGHAHGAIVGDRRGLVWPGDGCCAR